MGRRMAKKKAPAKDKTKHQRKRSTLRQKKVIIKDPLVREHWDDKLTLKQNYARIGLSSNSNDLVTKAAEKAIGAQDGVLETGVIGEDGQMTTSSVVAGVTGDAKDAGAVAVPKEETSLIKAIRKKVAEAPGAVKMIQSDGQRDILERLVAKHGNNFKAMERDIKINTWQHSAKVLEKRCKRYLKELEGGVDH